MWKGGLLRRSAADMRRPDEDRAGVATAASEHENARTHSRASASRDKRRKYGAISEDFRERREETRPNIKPPMPEHEETLHGCQHCGDLEPAPSHYGAQRRAPDLGG